MLKVALGIDNLRVETNLELYVSVIWMFVGLSLFGYGIGNISA